MHRCIFNALLDADFGIVSIADLISPEEQRALLARWLDTVTRLSGHSATDKSLSTPIAIRARLLLEMGATGTLP